MEKGVSIIKVVFVYLSEKIKKKHFLQCPLFTQARSVLMDPILSIYQTLNITLQMLPYGNKALPLYI